MEKTSLYNFEYVNEDSQKSQKAKVYESMEKLNCSIEQNGFSKLPNNFDEIPIFTPHKKDKENYS